MTRFFLLLIISVGLLAGCSSEKNAPTTVSKVNLKKYMGTWYEIASFPNSFQKGCRCTRADYSLIAADRVRVLNKCYKGNNKKISLAKGEAWPVSGSNNSKLKVQFFWPFRGDYWILYLSPTYQQVIVGSPNRKYLWILARTPHITETLYQKLVMIASEKGFATDKLNKTLQNCGDNLSLGYKSWQKYIEHEIALS